MIFGTDPGRYWTSIVFLFLWFFLPITGNAKLKHQQLPIKAFANLPDFSQVRLSPNGKYVTALNRVNTDASKGSAIVLYDLSNGNNKTLLFSDNQKYLIDRAHWASNQYVFVEVTYPSKRYGTPTDETRLLIVDIETGKSRSAVSKGYIRKHKFVPQIQTAIIDSLPQDPQHFLLALDKTLGGTPAVYKVSLAKDKMKLVQLPRKNVEWWYTDRQSRVRIGVARHETSYKVIHRRDKKDRWETFWEFEAFSKDQIWPLGFDHDANQLYVQSLYEGRNAVFKVDLSTNNRELELIYADPKYDVNGDLIYSMQKKKVVGLDTDIESGFFIWDEDYLSLANGIDKAMPKTHNQLLMLSENERKYLMLARNARQPGTYMLGDRNKNTLTPIANRYGKLRPELLANKNKITYKARDGLEIEAFLTLPLSYKKGDKLPTIIHPHGGPISFDGLGFDYWTQFFANRGYAVLQMNFRGSSGYGHDFMAAGLGKWGLAMQDDVEDGTRWLIDKGFADPERICIVGASYGGYAALMGAAKTPDLYKCVVSFAGVTDINYLVQTSRKYTNYDIVKKQIGSKRKDMKARSPVRHADQIQAPVLLIHGTKDNTVKVQHSRKMHSALKKKKKTVEYIELEDGNHFLSNGDHRLTTFKAMEKFLAQHLGSEN